jgi:hypothetical protein
MQGEKPVQGESKNTHNGGGYLVQRTSQPPPMSLCADE